MTPERFANKLVRRTNGCLEWTGYVDPVKLYGRIVVNHRKILTHRFAWELAHGPIPAGLNVLHHCDNPPCCDAYKCLFLGTQGDNNTDKAMKGRARNGRLDITHCPDGHPYDEANTYVTSQGYRQCLTCNRARRVLRSIAEKEQRKAAKVANCISQSQTGGAS